MNYIIIILKLVLCIIIIFFNTICYILLSKNISSIIFNNCCEWFISLFNLKINIHGDIISEEHIIYVSNHYIALELVIFKFIFSKYRRTLYTVGQEITLKKSLRMYLLLNNIKKNFYNSLNIIPYKMRNKESGSNVKSTILELFKNEDCNIMICPSGSIRTIDNILPLPFKPGIFKLAAENNIKIRPITLKYNRIFKKQINSQCNIINILEEWFNLTVDVYIHDIQQNSNWEKLRDDCYNLVCEPLKK
jgi:1-acyl-sn-glycerol-3-phosphate acyltransferase